LTKEKPKIAIFGATGHIGKNLSFYFSQNKKNNLILFGRNEKKLVKTMNIIIPKTNYSFAKYDELDRKKYDVIINCVGIGNPGTIKKNTDILEITEYYDNKILEYIKKKKTTLYINFSSGAIFGQKFESPVTEFSTAVLNVNKLNKGSFYAMSKLYSEVKHRNLDDLNIVDLRIFSFFSRFINIKDEFLMSKIVNSIKFNKKFITDRNNIVRDYVHPKDLIKIIEFCMQKQKINTTINVSSKKPITKFELLKSLNKKYSLNYIFSNKINTSPTGLKAKYYSKSKKIKKLSIVPKYTSLQTILMELKVLMK
jgi:nucleoside-diphosphate-sugar epimerase